MRKLVELAWTFGPFIIVVRLFDALLVPSPLATPRVVVTNVVANVDVTTARRLVGGLAGIAHVSADIPPAVEAGAADVRLEVSVASLAFFVKNVFAMLVGLAAGGGAAGRIEGIGFTRDF